MKGKKILTILVLALSLVLWLAEVCKAPQEPMGTAFTYQGRLIEADEPASGQYDFEFKLYKNSEGGPQAGTTLDVNEVAVIDGYFTVELDFGSEVFDGYARWLEIGVRPGDMNDPNVYTVLSPRQEVTPTPYAIYAPRAGSDDDWMVSGTDMYSIPSGNVGIGTDPYHLFHVSKTVTGDWIAVIHNTGVGAEDKGLMVRANGGDPLQIQSFNKHLLTVRQNGNVGIGTTGPAYPFHLSKMHEASWIAGIHNQGIGPDAHGLVVRADGGDPFLVQSYTGDIMNVKQDGKVGIGTSSPDAKLEVGGDLKVTGAYKGNISSSSGSDGAPFPRPAYDSGWVAVAQASQVTLTHNIGGNVDNYVVDLQFKADPLYTPYGVNNFGYGVYHSNDGDMGAFYHSLTTTSVKVVRAGADLTAAEVRVRIWVYN